MYNKKLKDKLKTAVRNKDFDEVDNLKRKLQGANKGRHQAVTFDSKGNLERGIKWN